MKKLIAGITCLLLISVTGNALAVDDGALHEVENKAQSANAKADGNNSRIQRLEAEVADLQSQIDNLQIGTVGGFIAYAYDGTKIGLITEGIRIGGSPVILSDMDYFFQLQEDTGEPLERIHLRFSEPDCQGQAYVFLGKHSQYREAILRATEGTVATLISEPISDPNEYYYLPKGSTILTERIEFQSRKVGIGCENYIDVRDGFFYMAWYPNDPEVTGINPPYEMPFTISR